MGNSQAFGGDPSLLTSIPTLIYLLKISRAPFLSQYFLLNQCKEMSRMITNAKQLFSAAFVLYIEPYVFKFF